MEVEESPIPPSHKLCGFLTTVLSSIHSESKTLEFGTRLELFSQKSDIVFKSNAGVILSPIPYSGGIRFDDDCLNSTTTTPGKKTKKKKKGSNVKSPKKVGNVQGNGIVSVIRQLKTLLKQKCLEIVTRVVGISIREGDSEIRVAVLVDVYLPIALELGWQFPKSATTAASVFRHL
ncbi:hypothetical protein SOVF_099390, partial [Spinacia oleracea]